MNIKSYSDYIGKKMKGFTFEPTLNCICNLEMEKLVGKVGTITEYQSINETFRITFEEDLFSNWRYPAMLTLENLYEEHPQIPEMPIGTFCWVWDGTLENPKTHKRYVLGTKNKKYMAWRDAQELKEVDLSMDLLVWDNAEPVVPKTITKEEAEKLLEEFTQEIYIIE
jgi:hypothetical protein